MADATPTGQESPSDTQANPIVRHQSDHAQQKGKLSGQQASDKSKSLSHLPLTSDSADKRKVSIVDSHEGVPRRSMQFSRKAEGRQSTEFDRRVDGPFGRPSITMVRRASQTPSHPGQEDTLQEDPTSPIELTNTIASAGAALPFAPHPPPLNYDLWIRKWWILGFWTLVVFDSVVCPVVGGGVARHIIRADGKVGAIFRTVLWSDTGSNERQHGLQHCHCSSGRHEYL